MKALADAPATKDRIAVKTPLIVDIVHRYRKMTKTRQPVEEIREARPPSLRIEDRRKDLVEFYRSYESFIESICDAAQFGMTAPIETTYKKSRNELINGYASLRTFLAAFLRSNTLEGIPNAAGLRFDAFDALLESPTLELFLNSDDGNTIGRITKTREALQLYSEHLRQIAEKSK